MVVFDLLSACLMRVLGVYPWIVAIWCITDWDIERMGIGGCVSLISALDRFCCCWPFSKHAYLCGG